MRNSPPEEANKVVRLFRSFVNHLSTFLALIAGVIVLLVTLMITYAVIARKAFNTPLGLSVELSNYAVIAIVFLPLAFIQAQRRHVSVEVIASRLSPRKQVVLDLFASVVCFIFTTLLTWKSGEIAWNSYRLGLRSATTLAVPLYLPQALIPLGGFLACLQFLLAIYSDVCSLAGRNLATHHTRDKPRTR